MFFVTVFFRSGAVQSLRENMVARLNQTLAEMQNTLQEKLLHDSTGISDVYLQLQQQMKTTLTEKDISLADFTDSTSVQNAYLQACVPYLQSILRVGDATGAFVVLGSEADFTAGSYTLNSLYLRNAGDGSGAVMEIGLPEIAEQYNLPLDALWSATLRYNQKTDASAMQAFSEPVVRATGSAMLNLHTYGYWSEPFYLHPSNALDTEKIITYTVPLQYKNATIGVLGIELSVKMLQDLLAPAMRGADGDGGFLLVKTAQNVQDNNTVVCRTLTPLSSEMGQVAKQGDTLTLTRVKDEPLYSIEGSTLNASAVYGNLSALHLYGGAASVGTEEWALLAVGNHRLLFGGGDRLFAVFVLCLVLVLAGSAVLLYYVVRSVTRPVRRAVQRVADTQPGQPVDIGPTAVQELDALRQVLLDVGEKQRNATLALISERERYMTALQSSTDEVFEYDVATDTFTSSEFAGGENGQAKEVHNEHFSEVIKASQLTQPEQEQLLALLRNKESGKVVCRSVEKAVQEWFEWRGKAVQSPDGKACKVIGSVRNVTAEVRQKQQKEAQSQKDHATGLRCRQYAEQQVQADLAQGLAEGCGCIMLLDIDGFGRINAQQGSFFADALLAELAQQLRSMMPSSACLARFGGDEIMVWLPQSTVLQARQMAHALQQALAEIRISAQQAASCCFGISAAADAAVTQAEMVEQARFSISYAKSLGRGVVMDYSAMQTLPQAAQWLRTGKKRMINAVAAQAAQQEMALIPFAFDPFEKVADIQLALPLLLRRTGRQFDLCNILVCEASEDFNTVQVLCRWNGTGAVPLAEQSTVQLSAAQYKEGLAAFDAAGNLLCSGSGSLTAAQQRFLQLPQGVSAYGCSMYENGCCTGFVLYMRGQANNIWQTAELTTLSEVTRILTVNRAKRRIDMASRAKSEFLSRMSHEIRTPMNAIMGMTDIAKAEKNVPPRVQDCLAKIDFSTKYLLRIINDVLDMSKIESGRLELEKAPLPLHRLLEDTLHMFSVPAAEKGVRLQLNSTVQGCVVQADSLRLSQVLINLLSNAMKFTSQGGCIKLCAHIAHSTLQQAEVAFAVQDNGIGIASEDQKRIFTAFEQASGKTAQLYGGTGLGLAICDSLVRMMGGEMTLESTVGEGSTFAFTLPFTLAEEQDGGLPPQPQGKKENSLRGRRVLLAEDNEMNTEIAKALLEMEGMVVDTAANGQQAVEMFCAQPPHTYDVILMDIRMPVMDGFAATRAIRALPRPDAKEICIIAMTANAFNEDMKQSVNSGMNGHLSKPVNRVQLTDYLQNALRSGTEDINKGEQ